MKVSLNWLTDYVDVAARPAKELAEVFTRIGLCCDQVVETATDVVFELEVTSNRPDCLGHIGVARELAAALGLALKLPDLSAVPTAGQSAGKLTSVQVLDPDLCPRYTARVIRGVKVGPSPAWMLERLESAGLRGINNIVDVTNYVLLEYSQPLHSFDYDLLGEKRIVVRRGRAGEALVSIDGTRCELTGRMCVIADATRPVAIAGIMGGLDSEINDRTVNVLLESARFDPLATRQTARGLSLMSEASYRFERGVDPVGVDAASLRACQLILQTAGGRLAPGVVDVWADPYVPAKVAMRTARCRMLLGMDVPDAVQVDILARLGLSPRVEDGRIVCTIPAHRPDLTREVDLIEEVGRLYGYDRISVRSHVTHRVRGATAAEQVRERLVETLAAAGIDEAVTTGFVDDAEAAMFGCPRGVRVDPLVRKTTNLLRPTLLPSLLRACKTNQDVGNTDVRLYELAAVFPPPPDGKSDSLPDEHESLGILVQDDLPLLRGVVETLAGRLAPAAAMEIVPAALAGLAADASAEIRIDGRCVGQIGMVDPGVLDTYGLRAPYAAATVRLEALLAGGVAPRSYRPLPKFPAVRRDLSVVVDAATSWSKIVSAIEGVEQPRREAVEYVGIYRGKQVPAGRKSVTLTLTYRSPEGTLRSEAVDELVGAVVSALSARVGASLRH